MSNKITHDSMRTSTAREPTNQGPQTYVVEDASDIDSRMAQFEAPAKPRKPISKELEKLIFIGRSTREIEIDGAKFELSTLLNKEQEQIVKTLYSYSNPGDLFTVRSLTLAHALKSVDGVSLDEVDIDGEFEDDFQKRVAIINCMQLSVVERLFTEYENLFGNTDKATDGEEVKNL